MNNLSVSEQIKILLKRRGMTAKELAHKLNTTPQNLQNKLTRDDFKTSDIKEIAAALDAVFVCELIEKEKL